MMNHLLLVSIVVSTILMRISPTMAAPSVGAWFAGFDQSDYEEVDEEESNVMTRVQPPPHLVRRSPLLQVPCGIILTGLTENHHSPPQDSSSPPSFGLPPQQQQQQQQQAENVHPVQAYCDTGVTETTMTYRAAQKAGLLPLIQFNPKGGVIEATTSHLQQARGDSAGGGVSGASLWLRLGGSTRATVAAPAIVILPRTVASSSSSSSSSLLEEAEDEQELVLGLDFLRQVNAIVDLRNEELQIMIDHPNDEQQQQQQGYLPQSRQQEDVILIPLIRLRASRTLNSGL
jgi:hypothetical protein